MFPGDLYYLNSVSDVHLQKGIEKDEKRVEDIQKNTSKIKMELEQARKGFLTAAPGADGVTGQELAGGGEEDHQFARGGLGMDRVAGDKHLEGMNKRRKERIKMGKQVASVD